MLNVLTSFRFFAAMLVFVMHAGYLTDFQLGYIGVSFFFVLSGFILTYNYFDRLVTLKGNLGAFYIARIAKIFPLHILTFLMIIPLTVGKRVLEGTETLTSLLSYVPFNLTLTQSFIPDPKVHFSFNGVSWSLSNEMFFYLVFPFIIYLFNKLFRSIPIKAILIIMVTAWSLMFFAFYGIEGVPLDYWGLYIFPLARVFDFTIGILLGLVFIKVQKTDQPEKIYKNTAVELIAIILLILAIGFSVNLNQSVRFSVYYLPFICFLIYTFAKQGGKISKIMSNKVFVVLGEISFSFYMIHSMVISYTGFILKRYFFVENIYVSLISLVITLAISFFLFYKFEEPMRKRIKSLYKQSVAGKNKLLNAQTDSTVR